VNQAEGDSGPSRRPARGEVEPPVEGDSPVTVEGGAGRWSGARPADTPSGESRRARAGAVAHRAASEVRAALRPFTLPNGITLLRFALVPFFVLAVIASNYGVALALFVAAGISDALDGALARFLAVRSRLGEYLDPIADKVLLVTAYVVLTWPAERAITIPVWLTVMALSRDVLIVLVALLLYLGADIEEFPPSAWGKVTTFLHIFTVGLVLLANIVSIGEGWLLGCFYVALAFTIISGVDYVRRAALMVDTGHHNG
jgi:cardiolipin synthase